MMPEEEARGPGTWSPEETSDLVREIFRLQDERVLPLCLERADEPAAVCEPHPDTRAPIAQAFDAFSSFRPVPEEVQDGLVGALDAFDRSEQVQLLSRLQEFGLPETPEERAADAVDRCANILVRLATGLISCRWVRHGEGEEAS